MNGLLNQVGRKCAVLLAVAAVGFGVPDCALAQSGETVEYIHTDALGSPVAVTNAAGEVIERTVYDPYGGVVNRPLSDGPGYTGHVTDASTGLSYMQQRYYDPGTGRFMTVDPVTADVDPRSLFNRYRYASNNPYRYTDPDGRVDWDMVGDAFKLEGAVGLGLKVGGKLGVVSAEVGLGEISWGGGFTLAPDAYAFQEVSGYSAVVSVGNYSFGRKAGVERSYQGRNGRVYSEETSKPGWFFGKRSREQSTEVDDNVELSGTATVIMGKLTGAVDIGKLGVGLGSPGSTEQPVQGFKGVYRVDGRVDSNRLEQQSRRDK